MDTQELEPQQINKVCTECGANRPEQGHATDCIYADDTIVGTVGETKPVESPVESPESTQAGWVLNNEPVHACIKPDIDNRTFIGSIWKCGGCGQNWLVSERRGQHKGEKTFRRITAENAAERVARAARRTTS